MNYYNDRKIKCINYFAIFVELISLIFVGVDSNSIWWLPLPVQNGSVSVRNILLFSASSHNFLSMFVITATVTFCLITLSSKVYKYGGYAANIISKGNTVFYDLCILTISSILVKNITCSDGNLLNPIPTATMNGHPDVLCDGSLTYLCYFYVNNLSLCLLWGCGITYLSLVRNTHTNPKILEIGGFTGCRIFLKLLLCMAVYIVEINMGANSLWTSYLQNIILAVVVGSLLLITMYYKPCLGNFFLYCN